MRILAFCRESYPVDHSTSYPLLHQSMALADMGHDVHTYSLSKRPMGVSDYLDAYEFDLVIIDLDLLRSEDLRTALVRHRRVAAVRMVGALYSLPPPPLQAWESVDFVFTPWKGNTISALARTIDIKYLPFGYSALLHSRQTDIAPMGPIFVGDATAKKRAGAEEYLKELVARRTVLCVGPGFEQKHLDPFVLGGVYAAARCLPNFHHSWAKGDDLILNERFWQTARCGVPVNDYHPLMSEVFDQSLVENFCFADKQQWRERIEVLGSGRLTLEVGLLAHLDDALSSHSYHDRMGQLLDWIT
jgi:hypothetical protein